MLPYQEDTTSITNVLDIIDTVSNEISEDAQIFHQCLVNVDDPDRVALMKHVISGERDVEIFEQVKNVN